MRNYFSDLEAPSVFLGGLHRISRMSMPCRANYSLLCPNIDFRQVSDPGSLNKTSTFSPVFISVGETR